MLYSPRPSSNPGTARELFDMHPGVSATLARTGVIDVYPFLDEVSPFIGFWTMIGLVPKRNQTSPDELTLLSYRAGSGVDTQITLSHPGSIDEENIRAGITEPELVIDMASAGVDLLHGYAGLTDFEREELPIIPYGNEKVFADLKHLRTSPVFAVARALLLLEP